MSTSCIIGPNSYNINNLLLLSQDFLKVMPSLLSFPPSIPQPSMHQNIHFVEGVFAGGFDAADGGFPVVDEVDGAFDLGFCWERSGLEGGFWAGLGGGGLGVWG